MAAYPVFPDRHNMKQLSREHQAIAEQKAAFAHFRPAIADEQSIEMLRFYDCLDGAVSSLILSELHMRQAERCKALNVLSELHQHSLRIGNEQNLKALAHLANAQAFAWKFRKKIVTEKSEKSFASRLDDFRHETREAFCQLEIKGSDAAELGEALDEVATVLRTGGGEAELFDFIDSAICSLEALRKTPGRGAQTNIAAWKLLLVRIVLALAAWTAWKCFHATCRCAQSERAVHGAVLAAASIVFAA
jgi:hypothetical protein